MPQLFHGLPLVNNNISNLIVQWGTGSGETNLTFAIAFSALTYGIVATHSIATSTQITQAVRVNNKSTTGATIIPPTNTAWNIIAIGY